MIHSARFATSESYQTHKLCTYANILIFKTPPALKRATNNKVSWKRSFILQGNNNWQGKTFRFMDFEAFLRKRIFMRAPQEPAQWIYLQSETFFWSPVTALRGKRRINFRFKTFFSFYFMFQIFLSAFSHSFIIKKIVKSIITIQFNFFLLSSIFSSLIFN